MQSNCAILFWLLLITIFSWMLLLLSISLPENHAFRDFTKYQSTAKSQRAPKGHDPCGACWQVGMNESDDTSREDASRPNKGRKNVGIGEYFYYNLHTGLTLLRVKLKVAKEYSGRLTSNITSLEKRARKLHQLLLNNFSPKVNPYVSNQPKDEFSDKNVLSKRKSGSEETFLVKTGYSPLSQNKPSFLDNLFQKSPKTNNKRAKLEDKYSVYSKEGKSEQNPWTRVTVIINGRNFDSDSFKFLLSNNELSTILVASSINTDLSNIQLSNKVSVIRVDENVTDGVVYHTLLQHVHTDYVLVAFEAFNLKEKRTLEYLANKLEIFGIWAVSGGVEKKNRQWKDTCLITKYVNHEAKWKIGNLGIVDQCSLCSAIDGPFLAVTSILQHISFDVHLSYPPLLLDLFLRAHYKFYYISASCQLANFEILQPNGKVTYDHLKSLANAHELYWIQYKNMPRLTLSCKEILVKCALTGEVLHPCCRKELSDMIEIMLHTCEAQNLMCELQEGTLLGALKMGFVLPWERDADITFHTANLSAFQELVPYFAQKGYNLHITDNRWCCIDGREAGGQGILYGPHWSVELWSQHVMDSEELILKGEKPTRIEFNGQWVRTPSSPGFHSRNRYGHELYRHSEHWLDTGKRTGWEEYDTSQFSPCLRHGHHACLDQFPPDGNLFFSACPL